MAGLVINLQSVTFVSWFVCDISELCINHVCFYGQTRVHVNTFIELKHDKNTEIILNNVTSRLYAGRCVQS